MSFSRAVTDANPALAEEGIVREDEDLVLIAKVREGDVAAFDRLTRKYRDRLFGVLYNLTSNREDAADLTQDAFIKAFQNIHKFKGKSAFYTWLYRIGVNTALAYLKKRRVRQFFSFEQMDDNATTAEVLEHLSQNSTNDKGALINELQEKLNEALQSLSLKHRTVVVLFEIEGLSHKEIAEISKTTEGTVRSRLHYAKQQLQSLLQNYL